MSVPHTKIVTASQTPAPVLLPLPRRKACICDDTAEHLEFARVILSDDSTEFLKWRSVRNWLKARGAAVTVSNIQDGSRQGKQPERLFILFDFKHQRCS